MILQYKEHLTKLDAEIDALAKNIEEYKIIKSIPGIGEIAAAINTEIGEIDRFNHPKKLVAFAGLIQASLSLVNSRLLRIELPREAPAAFDMPYIWLFVVPYVINVKKRKPMISYSLETSV